MMGWVSQELNGAREIGAKWLCNGGIVYEFDSPETTWLCNEGLPLRPALVAHQ